METEFAQVLNKFRRKLPPDVFSFMSQRIGISLVKQRSRAINAVEGGLIPPSSSVADGGLIPPASI